MKVYIIICLFMLVLSVEAQDRVEIELNYGTNLVSINILPPEQYWQDEQMRGPDVALMWEHLRREDGDHPVIYLHDERAQFYSPRWGYCGIPYWDLSHGYMVQVVEDLNTGWEGERIPADTEIIVHPGWNLIAYYPNYELDASADDFYVLSSIIDNVRMAVDNCGHFMVPQYEFSNMGPWKPGQGYYLLNDADDDVVLTYPEEADEEPVEPEAGNHWDIPLTTKEWMCVLVENIEGVEPTEGDQIGAFSYRGILTGLGDVHEGSCGIGLRGRDDHFRETSFFLLDGEEFDIIYWDEDQGLERGLDVDHVRGGMRFMSHGLVIIEITVLDPLPRTMIVPLRRGWNMSSINVVPPEEMWIREEGPDIIRMTEQLRVDDEHHLIILMKNEDGRFYAPALNFNNIPYWDLTQAYKIKVDADTEAAWSGEPILPDTEIPLEEGWNQVAYYPTFELTADSPDYHVLSPIIEHVIFAKDGTGHFMSPEHDFSNIPPWRETQGYQVKVDEDVILQYPERQDEVDLALSHPPLRRRGGIKGGVKTYHWTPPLPTGENMSVLVTISQSPFPRGDKGGIRAGDQVAAFNAENRLVGVGTIDEDSRCGLAVWGDDQATEEIDGLRDGEAFCLRLWRSGSDEEVDLEAGSFISGNGLVYEADGFIALDAVAAVELPDEFYMQPAYPNPFNAMTKISFGLPEASRIKISVFDISGRLVETLVDGDVDAGYHSVTWNAGRIPAGVYLVRMKAANFTCIRETVLLK